MHIIANIFQLTSSYLDRDLTSLIIVISFMTLSKFESQFSYFLFIILYCVISVKTNVQKLMKLFEFELHSTPCVWLDSIRKHPSDGTKMTNFACLLHKSLKE